jgi:hypothetical protein
MVARLDNLLSHFVFRFDEQQRKMMRVCLLDVSDPPLHSTTPYAKKSIVPATSRDYFMAISKASGKKIPLNGGSTASAAINLVVRPVQNHSG